MAVPYPAAELPRSLQAMIDDCRRAIAGWNLDEDADNTMMQSAREWTLRLSRGEFDDSLYWECAAEDCEEAGDWEGALSAYQQVLNIPSLHRTDYSKTHAAIGAINSLRGDDQAALASFHIASKESTDDSQILWRVRAVSEATQLLRMGKTRQARELIDQGLATWNGEPVDHLGIARLLIVSAKCDLAVHKHDNVLQSLQTAWDWLDALVRSYRGDAESMRQASGIHYAYVTWWLTEAQRRRFAGEGDSEIFALQQAIAKARLCFDPGGWRVVWNDLCLMRILIETANAFDRHHRPEEAAVPRAEADEIFARRRFPKAARESVTATPHTWRRTWSNLFNLLRR